MMEDRQWRWALLNWILLWMLLALALILSGVGLIGAQPATSTGSVQAQTEAAGEPPYYQLHIHLRYSDGTAVAGEPVIVERLPQELPMACITDERGSCTWTVGRGLYQVVFERPLDQVSALSLAEGGLRGFGLTVGEADMAYHFVFHHDGRAYFDAAPDAAVPDPIIPHFHSLQGGVLQLLDDQPGPTVTAATTSATPTADTAAGSAPVVANTAPAGTTVLWLVGLGLLLGGGLHLLQRGWPQPARRHKLASPLTTTTKLGRPKTPTTGGTPATAGTTAVAGQTGYADTHTPVDPTSITNLPTAAAATTEEENHHA